MSEVLALPILYDLVVARFALEAPSITHYFGWREEYHSESAPRIVWVPGDDEEIGEVLSPRQVGGSPRSLAMLEELFTVYLAVVDESDPDDERKQYTAARLLLDAWLRAVYLAAVGTYRVVALRWHKPKGTRRIGSVIRAVVTIEAVVPDVEPTFATPAPVALETPSMLDQTDEPEFIPEEPA